MAVSFAPALVALLIVLGAAGARAEAPAPQGASQGAPQGASQAAEATNPSLSPECRVPGSKLYTLAPLWSLKRALRARRIVKVLAIGSSSTAGWGASSPLTSYPVRLETELEKLFPGVEIDVTNRGISGEGAAGAAQRMQNTVAEVNPDLVVWQVGTNDALARIDLDSFTGALDDTIKWIKSHHIDVVLVDPQYTAKLAGDDYYKQVVASIQNVAAENRVPLVLRFEAMRYLAGQHAGGGEYLARDQFHLNDLGYRCMAEHVARAITVGILQAEVVPQPGRDGAAATK